MRQIRRNDAVGGRYPEIASIVATWNRIDRRRRNTAESSPWQRGIVDLMHIKPMPRREFFYAHVFADLS